jgi:hypothetical protein
MSDDQTKAPQPEDDNMIDSKDEVAQAFNQPETPEYDDPLDGDKPDERLEWSDLTGQDDANGQEQPPKQRAA